MIRTLRKPVDVYGVGAGGLGSPAISITSHQYIE
jgi:hypothetical protein